MTRYHLGGIGIVIALFIFLLLPLMTRNANHPLAGETKLDLCQLLGQDNGDCAGIPGIHRNGE